MQDTAVVPGKPRVPHLNSTLKERCRADLRLASILFLGVFAIVGVVPFALYRAYTGNWIMAAIDAALVAGMGVCVVLALRGASTARLGNAIAVVVSGGVLVTTALLGQAGLFWVFPVLLAVFMLTERRLAMGCVVAVLAGSYLLPLLRAADPLPVSFFVAAALVALFGFVMVALQEAQRADLQAIASRDPLTGAFNRRSMESELALALALHRRSGRSAALAMFDLDHFKRINDRHGHEAGDRALVGLATVVRDNTRRSDRLYRVGGEEFVLLLADTDRKGADCLLQKVHSALRGGLRIGDEPVRTSIGAAMLEPGTGDWMQWLRNADAALYEAKRRGRDCLCFHDPAQSDAAPATRGESSLAA